MGQNESQVWKAAFDILCKLLQPNTTDKEDLLLCLPAIAEAEAGRQEQWQDREGWLHLQAMFHKWFSGIPNTPAAPYWVDWRWLQTFPEIQEGLKQLSDPAYLFNEAAQSALKNFVKKEHLLENPQAFDCTVRDWPHWKADYFQRVDIGTTYPAQLTGLTIAIGRCKLCALAKGRVDTITTGHRITVTDVAIVLLDSFYFEDWQPLGMWNCFLKRFLFRLPYNVENSNFRNFKQKNGWGNNFLVIAPPKHIVMQGDFQYDIQS